jgi:hypothetical protein
MCVVNELYGVADVFLKAYLVVLSILIEGGLVFANHRLVLIVLFVWDGAYESEFEVAAGREGEDQKN